MAFDASRDERFSPLLRRVFLKVGGVFTDDLIDAYLELRWQEVYAMEHSPHPVEFDLYYSA